MKAGAAVHLNLDDAWADDVLGLVQVDAREWGPRLRFSAPAAEVERFYAQYGPGLAPVVVYGSGDFHHLTALWLRRLTDLTTVVSFDNHPDWDIRPPRWGCGGWVNRALELFQIEQVSVWGCGNFECWWPGRIFANNPAERAGRLEVHPWADKRSARAQARRGAIVRENWREKFSQFVATLAGRRVYVTIDLDCLRSADAVTNWESGRFKIDDLAWALDLLGCEAQIAGGDICGAWSPPRYARWKQRFASGMDHPRLVLPGREEIRRRNEASLRALLPLLAERNENNAEADQDRPDR